MGLPVWGGKGDPEEWEVLEEGKRGIRMCQPDFVFFRSGGPGYKDSQGNWHSGGSSGPSGAVDVAIFCRLGTLIVVCVRVLSICCSGWGAYRSSRSPR